MSDRPKFPTSKPIHGSGDPDPYTRRIRRCVERRPKACNLLPTIGMSPDEHAIPHTPRVVQPCRNVCRNVCRNDANGMPDLHGSTDARADRVSCGVMCASVQHGARTLSGTCPILARSAANVDAHETNPPDRVQATHRPCPIPSPRDPLSRSQERPKTRRSTARTSLDPSDVHGPLKAPDLGRPFPTRASFPCAW
jgi:hypothetical protein